MSKRSLPENCTRTNPPLLGERFFYPTYSPSCVLPALQKHFHDLRTQPSLALPSGFITGFRDDLRMRDSDFELITGTRYPLGPPMRPLLSQPSAVPRQKLRPFRHQVTKIRSEVLTHGMLTTSLNSRSLEKPSSPPNRKEQGTTLSMTTSSQMTQSQHSCY